MNTERLKHFAMKRVKDQSRFYVVLAPHTVHFVDSLSSEKIDENALKRSLLHLSKADAIWFKVWQGFNVK